jgi:hypothetical protein
MMPIMVIVILVPSVVLIFLVLMLPGIVVESQFYARQFYFCIGMPTFIGVAGDIRGRSRSGGGYQAETHHGGKNAPREGCCMGFHKQSPFSDAISAYG